ncbi:MAG: DedA family protein [Flexilinea sp.]|nr:DedA family protein [Flexilinea sp.]
MSFTGVINAIYAFCQNAMQIMGYPGLSLVMFLENVFPPIPSEIVLPLAGTLTVSSDPEVAPQFNIVSVILWATLGSFLGAWIWYWVGYLISEERVRKLLQKIGKFIMITEKDLDTALDWFGKYGEWCVFFGRMVPIIRTLISVPAGLSKMHWLKFSLFTVAGTMIWNIFLGFAGRILGDNYTVIVDFVDKFKEVIIILCVLAVAAFYVHRILKKRKEK